MIIPHWKVLGQIFIPGVHTLSLFCLHEFLPTAQSQPARIQFKLEIACECFVCLHISPATGQNVLLPLPDCVLGYAPATPLTINRNK